MCQKDHGIRHLVATPTQRVAVQEPECQSVLEMIKSEVVSYGGKAKNKKYLLEACILK